MIFKVYNKRVVHNLLRYTVLKGHHMSIQYSFFYTSNDNPLNYEFYLLNDFFCKEYYIDLFKTNFIH
jgi:hypothetical protein